MWGWLSATVRLQENNEELTASAVYLTNKELKEELLVTLAPAIAERLAVSEAPALTACVQSSVTPTELIWDDVTVLGSLWLPGYKSILDPLGDSFTVVPHQEPKVTFLRFLQYDEERSKAAVKEFALQLEPDRIMHQKVVASSSPFASVNPAMFLGYLSQGIVNHVHSGTSATSSAEAAGILVDMRYLEGMEGAGVFLDATAGTASSPGLSIGLIAGTLIKASGEGRLTAVVPWAEILEQLRNACRASEQAKMKLELAVRALEHAAKAGRDPRPYTEIRHRYSGVVVVLTRLRGGRKAWGSGVLVAPDIIVTNKHVVGDFLSIEVWFQKYDRRNILAVAEPLAGVDLVFLRLSKHAPGKYKPVDLSLSDPKKGANVYSVGFGLFYPETFGSSLQPLYSRGIITKNVRSSIEENDAPGSSTGMIVSSAGCWNGSSGGALFNQANELVGVMASNARDESTGEIMPDMSFVIPIAVVRRALGLINAADQSKTSEAFQKLWRLQRTHLDTRRRLKVSSKL